MLKPWDILIPADNVDKEKFACVACDQFTGDNEYWDKVEKLTGGVPSAYHITFPEIYLSADNAPRIKSINDEMERYIRNGVFKTIKNAVIYVERTLCNGKIRKGIICAVDLEEYDFSPDSQSKIRPTEKTVEDRLPPRVAIRENAPLELPHILLLTDDISKTAIESLAISEKELIYDTDLMLSGGHIRGYRLADYVAKDTLEMLEAITTGIGENKITLAVGDGNHSVATAKRCWEKIKSTLTPAEYEAHPARYALCEIENLHDDALDFEPIHRIVYGVKPEEFIKAFDACASDGGQTCTLVWGNEKKEVTLSPTNSLTVGTVQDIIDAYINEHGGVCDYIHEPERVILNASAQNSVGVLLPKTEKRDLFPAVIKQGSLPRKTFSMGMGIDKRYYFEAKKIK